MLLKTLSSFAALNAFALHSEAQLGASRHAFHDEQFVQRLEQALQQWRTSTQRHCPVDFNEAAEVLPIAAAKSASQRVQQAYERQKAVHALAEALASVKRMPVAQALREVKRALAAHRQTCVRSGQTPRNDASPQQRKLASAYSRLEKFARAKPERADAATLKQTAIDFLAMNESSDEAVPSCARRLALLMRRARDAGAPGYTIDDPLTSLKAAYKLAGKQLSAHLSVDYQLISTLDTECLDAAALFQSCGRNVTGTFTGSDAVALASLRPIFLTRLEEQLALHRNATALIPADPSSCDAAAPWFDGLAIRNAFNRDLQQIASAVKPVSMDKDEAFRLVRQRFVDLLESPDYPIGTPFQSIATILLRLGPHLGVSETGLDQPKTLFQRFREMNDAWQSSPAYPVSPWLLAASHLARASGLAVTTDETVEKILLRKLAPERLLKELPGYNADTATELMQWLTANGYQLQRDLPALATRIPNTTPVLLRELIREFDALKTRTACRRPRSGELPRSGLGDYFRQRLMAYERVPVFEKQKVFESIMNDKLSLLSPQERKKVRIHLAKLSATLHALSTQFHPSASRLEDLRAQLASVQADPALEQAFSAFAETRVMVRQAREAYERDLPSDPVVLAKAKESFRLLCLPANETDITRLSEGIAAASLGKPTRAAERATVGRFITKLVFAFHQAASSTAPVETVFNALTSGDWKQILDLLPFVTATYDIEEGLRTHQWRQAGQGALRFGVDALFVWLGGLSERAVSASVARGMADLQAMSSTERIGLTMLREVEDEHAIEAPATLPLSLHEQLGTGAFEEPGLRMTGDRLLPSDDGLEPPVGEARTFDFAYSEEPDEVDLQGPCLSTRRCSPELASSLEEIVDRPTVQQASVLIDSLQAVPNNAIVRVDRLLEATGKAESEVIATLQEVVDQSPSLKLLCWNALREEPARERFRVRVQPGPPATFHGQKLMSVTRAEDVGENAFMDCEGERPFDSRRMYVHEFVHVVTRLLDDTPDGGAHRGPVVYLTNKILRELEHDSPERLVYQSRRLEARLFEDPPPSPVPTRIGTEEGVFYALQENRVLDLKLAKRRTPDPDFKVLGERVSQRFTVRRALAVGQVVGRRFPFHSEKFSSRLLRAFHVESPTPDVALAWLSISDTMESPALAFYRDSEMFRRVFDHYFPHIPETPWTISLIRQEAGATPPAKPWLIDREAQRISIYQGRFYIATHGGPMRLSFERQLVGMLVDLCLGQSYPETSFAQATNRGYQVLLENLILNKASPERARISAAVATSRAALRPDVFKASIAATEEDAFLENTIKQWGV